MCTRAIVRVAAETGVPIRLLWAIANVESRMAGKPSPYAVNDAEGRPHYFRSAAAAHDFVARAIRAGDRNLDIGCMQLNWRWHGQNLPSIAHAFDPYTNVKYAAGYLADLRRETGSWSSAVAFYHSRQRGRGEAYQGVVSENGK
jgi:soluble lytic murein transglycosylase-like protein